jgi:hypothetical protein
MPVHPVRTQAFFASGGPERVHNDLREGLQNSAHVAAVLNLEYGFGGLFKGCSASSHSSPVRTKERSRGAFGRKARIAENGKPP